MAIASDPSLVYQAALPSVATLGASLKQQRVPCVLTGHHAAAGSAWKLWWQQQNRRSWLQQRDAFLAQAHDPKRDQPARDGSIFGSRALAFGAGRLGEGSESWQRRAWQLLAMDESQRWAPALLQALTDYQGQTSKQIGLMLIADRLQLVDCLRAMQTSLEQQYERPEDMPSELRAALAAMKQPSQ